MKLSDNFPAQVALVLAGAALVLAYPLTAYASEEVRTAVAAGALVSTVNVLLGYITIAYSFEKSYPTFLKAVLGGMGLRMLMMLGVLLVLILSVHIHTVALMASLLGFYSVYLILEILFIQRKVSVRDQA